MFTTLTSHERGNASPAMNTTPSGSKTKSRPVPAKAADSIRNTDVESNEIDESELQYEKHDEQRISTARGIVIDLRAEEENTDDSIRGNRESFSNEIDESDLQYEKHDKQKISLLLGIITLAEQPKYQINFKLNESRMNDESIMKCGFPDSIEIEMCKIFEKAEPSIKSRC
jgi:hypothetical protein